MSLRGRQPEAISTFAMRMSLHGGRLLRSPHSLFEAHGSLATLDLLSKSPGAHLPRVWSLTMPGSAGVTVCDCGKILPHAGVAKW